jgi:hypothetical protein
MMTAEKIQEIINLYAKHDWKLRKVLLTKELKENLAGSLEKICQSNQIVLAEIDAAWFSRPSGKDKEAWELRRLSETPYALFQVFEADDDEEIRQEMRIEMEDRLK